MITLKNIVKFIINSVYIKHFCAAFIFHFLKIPQRYKTDHLIMEIQSLFNRTCYLNKVPKFKCIHLGFAQVEDSRDLGNFKKILIFSRKYKFLQTMKKDLWFPLISVTFLKIFFPLIFPQFVNPSSFKNGNCISKTMVYFRLNRNIIQIHSGMSSFKYYITKEW